MKIIAINGSPRVNGNTVTLLNQAIKGASSGEDEIELINLYKLKFKGCSSCFSCKRKNSVNRFCALKDDLTEVLEKVMKSDILLLGSPIYLGNVTGEMKDFLERLIFMNLSYDLGDPSYFNSKISTGFIYTMGIPIDMIEESGYKYIFESNKKYLQILNGSSEYIISADNSQFDDYSKYNASRFNEEHKVRIKKEQFPIDCNNAFEMGSRLSSKN